jgi:uncharacterized RDD family membrane protein YckC
LGYLAASATPGPTPGLVWGGVWTRLAALLIDLLLVGGSLFVVFVLIAMVSVTTSDAAGSASRSGSSSSPVATAVALIWWILALMYHPACWYVLGASVGQKLMGLRLARASDGRALGLGAVLTRYAIFLIVTLIFPLAIISGIMAARDPFKRAWHDKVARSVVVKNA